MALLKNNSRALQRQVDLTTAVCQERLLTTHVRHVLGLVTLVEDELPFDDALDIYVRILRLPAEQARNVGSRALAEIGRRGGAEPTRAEPEPREAEVVEEEDSGEGDVGRSEAMFSRLRRRVRGRVQGGLRRRINLAGARAEDAILETHVENSLTFARALGDGEDVDEADAVEMYLETMMLPEGVADVVYNRALRQIADRELPPVPNTEGDVPAAAARGSQATGERAVQAGQDGVARRTAE